MVLDLVCRLREQLLTRALRNETLARRAVESAGGPTGSEEQRIARQVEERQAKIHQGEADRCRAAVSELDSIRSIEDLVQWRAKFSEW